MIELAAVCIVFAAVLLYRERAHDQERARLLNRIQAPHVEVAQSGPEPSGEIHHVPLDDDESFWDLHDSRKARN